MPQLEPPADSRATERPSVPRRFQFSLFWLMATVTIVAVVLGLGSTLSSFLGELLYLAVCCVVPTPLIICVVFARGFTRAFAIGALVPWVILFPWASGRGSFLTLTVTLVLSVVCGVIAVGTWRWIRRNEGGQNYPF